MLANSAIVVFGAHYGLIIDKLHSMTALDILIEINILYRHSTMKAMIRLHEYADLPLPLMLHKPK